jgi:hypothetical protein
MQSLESVTLYRGIRNVYDNVQSDFFNSLKKESHLNNTGTFHFKANTLSINYRDELVGVIRKTSLFVVRNKQYSPYKPCEETAVLECFSDWCVQWSQSRGAANEVQNDTLAPP